jgi:hypothetical protein
VSGKSDRQGAVLEAVREHRTDASVAVDREPVAVRTTEEDTARAGRDAPSRVLGMADALSDDGKVGGVEHPREMVERQCRVRERDDELGGGFADVLVRGRRLTTQRSMPFVDMVA